MSTSAIRSKPETSDDVEVEVVAGGCRLQFDMGSCTGTESETNPGIGFTFLSKYPLYQLRDGGFAGGSGVIRRADAKRLAEAINAFLDFL